MAISGMLQVIMAVYSHAMVWRCFSLHHSASAGTTNSVGDISLEYIGLSPENPTIHHAIHRSVPCDVPRRLVAIRTPR